MIIKPLSYNEMCDFLLLKEKEAKKLYEKMTAKELAQHYAIVYNNNWQKACFRILGYKGLGLGGARNKGKKISETKINNITQKQETLVLAVPDDVVKILKSYKKNNTLFVIEAIRFYHFVNQNCIKEEITNEKSP